MLEEFSTHFAADIYSNDIHHQVAILQIISDYPRGLDVTSIQEYFPLSRRTIYKYIEEINAVATLAEENKTDDNIDYGEIKKENNLYYFTGNRISFQHLYSKIIDESVALIICKQLLVTREINVKQFCYDHYISETALRRNIVKFNNYMGKYGLSILIAKGFLSLHGTAPKIRFGLATFLWRNYRGLQWPFPNVSQKSMRNLALRIGTIYSIDFNQGKLMELMYILGVNFSQISVNNFISPDDISQEMLDLLILDDRDQEFYDYLTNFLGVNDTELSFIVLWFKSMSDAYSTSNRAQIIYEKFKKLNHSFYKKNVKYIMAVESRTNTKIDFSTPTGELFLATIISGQFHLNLFHDLSFTIANIDMDHFGGNIEIGLFEGIKNITLPNNNELDPGELNTAIMFNAMAFMLIFPHHYFDPQINILIKMDAPAYAEQIFTLHLREILDPYFNVSIFNQKSSNHVQPDLLVSTALFLDESIDQKHQIFVNPQLNSSDRTNLHKIVAMITAEKRAKK